MKYLFLIIGLILGLLIISTYTVEAKPLEPTTATETMKKRAKKYKRYKRPTPSTVEAPRAAIYAMAIGIGLALGGWALYSTAFVAFLILNISGLTIALVALLFLRV